MSSIEARQAKIEWLLAHTEMWVCFPNADHHADTRHETIVRAMKSAKLYSPSTYWADVHLYNLIVDARKQRRERQTKTALRGDNNNVTVAE